jgi:6-pyruvoyltetrahydropterin/6-carboxytetrahydropterin synthase
MQVTKIFTFAAAHRLYNYMGPCNNIHGHTYRLEVTVEGRLDKLGMVMDFKDLKQAVTSTVIEAFDHNLILYENDPLVAMLRETVPLVCMANNPTAENMLYVIQDVLEGARIYPVGLRLYETETSYAEL